MTAPPIPGKKVRANQEPRAKPLTDPTDLMTLLGRFGACFVLFLLTVVSFFQRHLVLGLVMAVASLFTQRATIRLWRRLRDERVLADVARDDVKPEEP